jgi:hypothetical protein
MAALNNHPYPDIHCAENVKISILICLLSAFLAFPAFCQEPEITEDIEYVFFEETPVVSLTGWRMFAGDDAGWADSAFDDSRWLYGFGAGLWAADGSFGKGIRWYRKALFFPSAIDTLEYLALYQVAIVSASEIYWDGQLIARNGVVADCIEDEVCGISGMVFPIPVKLTAAGRHVIAIRQSNYHTFSGIISPPVQLGYFGNLQASLFRQGTMSLFLAGIFLITALFHIVFLFGHAYKWTYAMFSGFCLSCAAFLMISSSLKYFQIDLGQYYTMAIINDVPWFLMMSLLPIFFLFEFSVPHRLALSLIITVGTLAIVVPPRLITFGILPVSWLTALDRINRAHSIITIVISIFVTLWAARRKIAGSRTVTIGLFIFLAGAYVSYRARIENGWAVGFAFVIMVITVSLSKQMAARNRAFHETQLRSTRLELELLKRQIQPHFLLNSLNSIVAWLEEEPAVATRLVNALAEELRMLLDFSGRKTVSFDEEIRLCRAHLDVMSLRREKKFEFTVNGECGSEQIPPLIIHTMIENGLTHGYKGRDFGIFRLDCLRSGDSLSIEIFNDSTISGNFESKSEGTGLRYVRTRLEESYPGAWSLQAGAEETGWKVKIEISGVKA